MPQSDQIQFAPLALTPGVNKELTATAQRAGYTQAQFARFRNGLVEKIGGWVRYYFAALAGVPRALLAWLDANGNAWLAIATTANLEVIQNNVVTDISPQTFQSDFGPTVVSAVPSGFAVTSGSNVVTITDTNLGVGAVGSPTTYDSVFFNTPVSVGGVTGGLILAGLYQINSVVASNAYTILAASNSPVTRSPAVITNITNANPAVVTAANNFANGDIVQIGGVVGMTQINGFVGAVSAVSGTQFTVSVNASGFGAYVSGGDAWPGQITFFQTSIGSAIVTVNLANHSLVAGNTIVFPTATTLGGVTIQGTYTVLPAPIPTTNAFSISATSTATASVTGFQNPGTGSAEIIYYTSVGPVGAGTAYSFGTYSSGPYGGAGAIGNALVGTDLVATDWTLDNWLFTLLGCPAGGPIFQWTPNSGIQNAQLIPTAPALNSGIFVAAPRRILIAYGTTSTKTIGAAQDPLAWRASDLNDYTFWQTNVVNPNTSATSSAFSDRIPTGTAIKAGLATPNQVLLWTDLDVWSLLYVGLPQIWTQTKIGSNCGTVSRHAVGQMFGIVYWMSRTNFHYLAGGAPSVIPCKVWDSIFQNLDTNNLDKCWCEVVQGFTEIWWFFPSASGNTGQCDTYVKVNIADGSWDTGPLPRSAGIGQSVVGNPVMASPQGVIYQHETGYNADTAPLSPVVQTGYFYIVEGEEFVTVDQFWPDFKYTTASGSTPLASVQVTFFVIDAAGDIPGLVPRVYGPYTILPQTQHIDVRFRGRQFFVQITSSDNNSFWRLGKPRFRYYLSGTR